MRINEKYFPLLDKIEKGINIAGIIGMLLAIGFFTGRNYEETKRTEQYYQSLGGLSVFSEDVLSRRLSNEQDVIYHSITSKEDVELRMKILQEYLDDYAR